METRNDQVRQDEAKTARLDGENRGSSTSLRFTSDTTPTEDKRYLNMCVQRSPERGKVPGGTAQQGWQNPRGKPKGAQPQGGHARGHTQVTYGLHGTCRKSSDNKPTPILLVLQPLNSSNGYDLSGTSQ